MQYSCLWQQGRQIHKVLRDSAFLDATGQRRMLLFSSMPHGDIICVFVQGCTTTTSLSTAPAPLARQLTNFFGRSLW
jgi:hypothetical protein